MKKKHIKQIDIESLREDAKSLMFVSDGSRGADKIARLLSAIPELLDAAEGDNEKFYDHLARHWRVFKKHRPVGANYSVGQLDGDCAECHTDWPCKMVRAVMEESNQ